MARTSFVPERERPERRLGRDDADFKTAGFAPATNDDDDAWELQSVENLVRHKMDAGEDWFTGAEMQAVASFLRIRYQLVKAELESFGLHLAAPERERSFRTFGTPNDRWTACPSHGGGGGDQISGFAGHAG